MIRKGMIILFSLFVIFMLMGCTGVRLDRSSQTTENLDIFDDEEDTALMDIAPAEKIVELEDGLSAVRYEGRYGFDEFLSGGGATTDGEVMVVHFALADIHERYEILMKALEENASMDKEEVRDTLDRVSKDNFGEFESTEWSIVFHLNAGRAVYYHREDYTQGYVFTME